MDNSQLLNDLAYAIFIDFDASDYLTWPYFGSSLLLAYVTLFGAKYLINLAKQA